MGHEYIFQMSPDNRIFCLGADLGGNLKVINRTKKYILLNKGGETVHLQRTDYVYAKPSYLIFAIKKVEDNRIITEQVEKWEWEYDRQSKKKIYAAVLKYFETLSAGGIIEEG